ncbi:coproporphyrinogen-III oxidase family protein [Fervidobacterium thailandense]|uniref:Radical SAM core domain-containing protein n=1 Tax=Fervidobacterium thailandense TaxID=1008305 RepID=A0A1E3G4N7_9BACT|nr:coproporphyrinogen-III oxidase family protein [Fervidobacterium thailandense]ODN31142.1 hypothetical protein A4H02_02430 [Fervidobacterium thailandense]
MVGLLTKAVRRFLVGSGFKFQFSASSDPKLSMERLMDNGVDALHLYVHVPFCRHTCPYCPYNKVPWNVELANLYFSALNGEIDIYDTSLGALKIPSVYFGGGSPAISPKDLSNVINSLHKNFTITGDLCLEINPTECTEETLLTLKDAGVSVISVGIQSFQDKFLELIGRDYTASMAKKVLDTTLRYFKNVNVDLMFALPNQTLRDVELDLRTAVESGARQITLYPLFTFPYSTVGRYRKLRRVKMPRLSTRRRQYYLIYDYLTSEGYEPVSVWSFMKKTPGERSIRYSSVTRQYYLGLGAGAGSHFPWGFYLNTFSVEAYILRLRSGKLPTALEFSFNKRMDDLFWLYWRFYDTSIPQPEFERRFGNDFKVKGLMKIFETLGFLRKGNGVFLLTKRGSFWIHLAQNHFALNYVNTIWSKALSEPFPEFIKF